jgi:hypothetical protein
MTSYRFLRLFSLLWLSGTILGLLIMAITGTETCFAACFLGAQVLVTGIFLGFLLLAGGGL